MQEQQNDKYRIIIGQRRFYAFQELANDDPKKWGRIPATVRRLDKVKATVASMIENVQRRDIAARDKAITCKFLLDQFGTTKAVAEELGVTERTVKKWLGYHSVPESIKQIVDKKGISPIEAIEISSNVLDEKKALEIAQTIVEKKMTKPQKERVIDATAEEPQKPTKEILKIAEEGQYTEDIYFVLPPKYAKGLAAAANDDGSEPSFKAKTIVMDWIRTNRYLS